MSNTQIYARIIVTIIGIAFPILLQIISRLDDRYQSNTILNIFNKEIRKWQLIAVLSISILSVVLWTLQLPPLFLENLLGSTADGFLMIASLLVIVVLVLTTIRIIKFYSVKQLAQHLLSQYESSNKNELKEEYFQAISDIFILSIKQDRPSIAKLISDFLYNEYKKVREASEQFVEYPQSYTNLILRATEILAKNKSSTFQFVNYGGIGGIWLLGESGDYKISRNTYWTLWRAIKNAIEYGRDDMVLFYWQNAHQYYAYNLSINYNYPSTEEQKNDYKEKKNRRLEFLYFNFYLGGLLLQEKNYECLI